MSTSDARPIDLTDVERDTATGDNGSTGADTPSNSTAGGGGVTGFDANAAETAVRDLLRALGEDPEREGLLETPARVTRMWRECLAGTATEPEAHLRKTFDIDHHEVVIVRDITFSSFCEHHMLPFTGTASIGYLPGDQGRFAGLSKFARLVDGYARRLQVQERLTSQLADAVASELAAQGVVVLIEAAHSCMSLRGVMKEQATTATIATRGTYSTDPMLLNHIMQLLKP